MTPAQNKKPEIDNRLRQWLTVLEYNHAFYKAVTILDDNEGSGKITLVFSKGQLKFVEPSPGIKAD